MKKYIVVLICAALIFVCLPIHAEENIGDYTASDYVNSEFDEGSVIAGIKQNYSGVSLFSPDLDLSDFGITEIENLDSTCPTDVFMFSDETRTATYKLTLEEAGRENVIETVKKLNELPYVEYAEPNYIYTCSFTPNDEYYSDQYSLEKISAPQAWDLNVSCKNVVVAVIDSGVMLNHPDLKRNIWVNMGEIAGNNIDDDGNGYIDDVYGWDFYDGDNDPSDENGHGTHVAGIVGAVTNNNAGIASFARDAQILPLRVLGADGSGTSDYIYRAIQYANRMNIPVINNSYGSYDTSIAIQTAIANSKKSLFVISAGNDTNNNDVRKSYPASLDYSNILSVASSDQNDELSDFSNYGKKTVDIAAPGSLIMSTYVVDGVAYMAQLSGTSMASPLVSSVAAAVKAKYPDMTPEEIIKKIEDGTDKISSMSAYIKTGGRLNAYEAIATHAESVSLDKSDAVMTTGEILTLTETVSPSNTTDTTLWTSSNTRVATVSGGTVTANAAGTATITVACGSVSAECDITVYSVYDVSFETNGGTINSGLITDYYGTVGAPLPTDVTRVGYTFGGWYDNEELTGEAVTEITAADIGDKTYYAKWTANTYAVELNANGGTTDSVTEYTYGAGAPLPTDVTRVGYTFGGWYNNEELTGEAVTEIIAADIGDKTYYAKWTANTYAVELNANGGATDGVTEYTYGAGAPLPTDVTRTGYTFGGWYDNEELTGEAVTEITAADIGDKTYYAKWKKNKYRIAFLNYDNTELQSGEIEFDEIPTFAGIPERQNDERYSYTFIGWSSEITAARAAAEYTARYSATPIDSHIEYKDGNAITASPREGTYCVVFAAYKDNVLHSADVVNVEFLKAEEIAVTPSDNFNTDGADFVKVMLWNTFEDMTPLCAADAE